MNEECWKKLKNSIKSQLEAIPTIKGRAPGFCHCGNASPGTNCIHGATASCPKLEPKGKLGPLALRRDSYFRGRRVWLRFQTQNQGAGGTGESQHPKITYWATRATVTTTRFGVPFAVTVAPDKWAAEPPGPSPAAYREAYEKNSRRITRKEKEEAREAYLAEIRASQDFAAGIHAIELRDNKRKAFRGPENSGESEKGDADYCPARVQGANPIDKPTWRQMGFRVGSLPDPLLIESNDRKLLAAILAKSPGRKVGRPPKKVIAMTDAERARESRQRKKEQV